MQNIYKKLDFVAFDRHLVFGRSRAAAESLYLETAWDSASTLLTMSVNN
jgi:hypothetical protein